MSAQVIGYLGENGVRDVRIPIGHLLEKWPGLRPSLVMVPVGGSDDEAYPVQYTMDGTDLVWHVSDEDTAVAGMTKAAVRMVGDGGRVGMDEPFHVIISPNLSAGGEPPVVIKPWFDQLVVLVPRAEAAAERAENAAERAENAAQNWENGTASNSNKLGGKPPEYYLPAVDLLDNSDFCVFQRGENIENVLTISYGADRWLGNGNLYRDYQKTADGVRITARTAGLYIGIQQRVPAEKLKPGIYTVVAELTPYMTARMFGIGSDICEAGVRVSKVSHITVTDADIESGSRSVSLGFYCLEDGSDIPVGFSFVMHRVSMYEGSYTADNLPPFVPPDPTLELAKCQSVYLPISYDPLGNGYTTGGGGKAYILIPTPVPMRTDTKSIPSIIYDTPDFYVRCNGTDYLASSVGVLAKRGENFIIVELVNSELPPRQVVAAYKLTPGVALSTEP